MPADNHPANLLAPLCSTHPSAGSLGCQQALLSGRTCQEWDRNSDASLSVLLFSTRPPRVTKNGDKKTGVL